MSKPTKIYGTNGVLLKEKWYKDGRVHREDGSAKVYYVEGNVSYEFYYKEGRVHRLDGPCYISYLGKGGKSKEWWSKDGVYHREDGPTYVRYEEDGSVVKIGFWLEGKWGDFWDFFDRSSEDVQKTLLRDWLSYCHLK
jgi:hypothetical protein